MSITRSRCSPGPGLRCQLHPAPQGPPTRSNSSSSSTQPGLGGGATLAAASGKGEEGLSPPCHPPPHLSKRKVPRTPAAGAGKVSACHRQNQRDGNHPRQARVTSHPWECCRRGVGAVTASHGANRADEGHLQKSTRLAAPSIPQAAVGRGKSGQGQAIHQRTAAGLRQARAARLRAHAPRGAHGAHAARGAHTALAGCTLLAGCTAALEKPRTDCKQARAEQARRKVLIRSKAGRQLEEQDASCS